MTDYRRINVTHHLSSYKVLLPIWDGDKSIFEPFNSWRCDGENSPSWYQAYNASKHDRHKEFKKANFENLVSAVAGLLVLISAQFGSQEFGAGDMGLSIGSSGHHEFESATGSLFRIEYPNDWSDRELYDFDWSVLKNEEERFSKIDFDAVFS